MTFIDDGPQQHEPAAGALVEETAARLRDLLAGLASRLRPFPAFLNMVSVQAVELDPPPGAPKDQGCVVVLPGGEICELDLKALPGIEGIRDIDPVEETTELELPPEEYIFYAAAAIRLLYQELRRREG
jgi:hypothetical protein